MFIIIHEYYATKSYIFQLKENWKLSILCVVCERAAQLIIKIIIQYL